MDRFKTIKQPELNRHIIHDKSLLEMLPDDQLKEVLNQELCDIDTNFLGFTEIYRHLSEMIPLQFTIIDFGCAYAPQCFYFEKHKKYIGVDVSVTKRFNTDNALHYLCTIRSFIETHIKEIDIQKTFAICSYVPPWHDDNMKIVRENFIHMFTYYPQRW